jgi:hypothetical protein
MRFDELDEKNLVEIVRLYEKYCGFERDFQQVLCCEPSAVIEDLKASRFQEYRIGSRWHSESKIYLKTDSAGNITLDFNSNMDPIVWHGKEYAEAHLAGSKFVKAAMQYLSKKQ